MAKIQVGDNMIHNVVGVYAGEATQQKSSGSWSAILEIHQQAPDYINKDGLKAVHRFTFFFSDEPDWKAGAIYEVPHNE